MEKIIKKLLLNRDNIYKILFSTILTIYIILLAEGFENEVLSLVSLFNFYILLKINIKTFSLYILITGLLIYLLSYPFITIYIISIHLYFLISLIFIYFKKNFLLLMYLLLPMFLYIFTIDLIYYYMIFMSRLLMNLTINLINLF